MSLGIVQVEVYLPSIRMSKRPRRQLDDDQAPQTAMVQQQIDPIPDVADPNPLLPGDKCEPGTQLQQEPFEMPDQGLFQFALAVFILEVEKLKEVRIAELSCTETASWGKRFWPFASMAAWRFEWEVRS